MSYSDDEAKAKGCLIVLGIALLIVILVVVAYFESINPEDIQGQVLDKEKVVHTQTHSGKDYFYVSSYNTYHVKVLKYADEVEERFDVNEATYSKLTVGDTGDYHVTGVRALGRNLNVK